MKTAFKLGETYSKAHILHMGDRDDRYSILHGCFKMMLISLTRSMATVPGDLH